MAENSRSGLQAPVADHRTRPYHHEIEDIARAFGVEDPPNRHGSAFDRVWIIEFKDGNAKLCAVPRQLLYGDSAD
jgi:hypothetical protein